MKQISQRTVRRPVVVRPDHSVAAAQFVKELEHRARQEELDRLHRERWEARRPQIQAQEAKERKVLAYALGAAVVLGLAVTTALVFLLMSVGFPLIVAIVLALLLGGGSSCTGCTVIVQVFH